MHLAGGHHSRPFFPGSAGVTFYNTACGSGLPHSTCPTGSRSYNGAYKPFVLSGGVTGTLSAPTSGPYNNMLLMQDRTLAIQSSQETVSGGSTANFNGTVYLPRSPLVFSGGAGAISPNLALISWKLTVSGSPSVDQSSSSGQLTAYSQTACTAVRLPISPDIAPHSARPALHPTADEKMKRRTAWPQKSRHPRRQRPQPGLRSGVPTS